MHSQLAGPAHSPVEAAPGDGSQAVVGSSFIHHDDCPVANYDDLPEGGPIPCECDRLHRRTRKPRTWGQWAARCLHAVPPSCRNVRHTEAFSDADVHHIIANLRDVDRYECLAFGSQPGVNTAFYVAHSTVSKVFYYRDRPTFILGAIQTIPGVFIIWGYGTDDTWRVMPEMTRVCRAEIATYLFETHCARRLFVQLPLHPMCFPNIDWLKRVGFKVESVSPFSTVDDESVVTLAVTKPDYLKVRNINV